MKLKPIPMKMILHMSCELEHMMTFRNEQYGLTRYSSTPVNIRGKKDLYYMIDGDETEYRDIEKLKAAIIAKFPELEDAQ